MSDNEFIEIEDFEEALRQAREKVDSSNKGYCLNFAIKFCFDAALVKTPQLLDSLNLAQDFQNLDKPDTLYINHGQYIGSDGIPHVINELRDKHTSNRALISLISQKDIVNSGDEPIPSFMVLQFSVEEDGLYITTYFRALEVTKFLRINLEEIRIIADKICQSIKRIKKIKLNIFAFRAYANDNLNPLQRPKIEFLDEIKLLKLMEKKPTDIANLLREKLNVSTVIENSSIRAISEILNDEDKSQDVQPCLRTTYIKRILQKCISVSNELINLRKSASHNGEIDELNQEYLASLRQLIEEIEKCE
ncbi:hypothetical protein [Nostoc sp.]|uniref:hypothetical protein n=1 Tax=Nostoc sp. TaxID=1180 RepID=UPI002FFD4CEB